VLRSDCNRLRKESYKNPITVSSTKLEFHFIYFPSFLIATNASLTAIQKEEYEASKPKEPNGADDDVIEVPRPSRDTQAT
jgi:hypothetical protein